VNSRAVLAFIFTAASAAAIPSTGVEPVDTSAMPATALDVASVLEKVGAEDRAAGDRLNALSTQAVTVHALLLARARTYVRMARAGLLPLGGGLDALVDHASKLERLRRALAHDLALERQISDERVALAKRRDSLEDRKAVLESEHAALARSHAVILAAEERESAFRQAFLGNGAGLDHTAVYSPGVGPLDPRDGTTGFAALKGRLPFPIEGRSEIRVARIPGADGPGLKMAAAAGSVVHAVSGGRVAFADEYADYGRAVIVDHGSGYYTVSGNLAAIDVKVGDEVTAGARLGTVVGGDGASGLYFEIRHGAQTVPPSPWFGI
jgi:murein hydrolase activator